MKRFEAVVESNNAPNTGALWINKGLLKYYRNGKWVEVAGKSNDDNNIGDLNIKYFAGTVNDIASIKLSDLTNYCISYGEAVVLPDSSDSPIIQFNGQVQNNEDGSSLIITPKITYAGTKMPGVIKLSGKTSNVEYDSNKAITGAQLGIYRIESYDSTAYSFAYISKSTFTDLAFDIPLDYFLHFNTSFSGSIIKEGYSAIGLEEYQYQNYLKYKRGIIITATGYDNRTVYYYLNVKSVDYEGTISYSGVISINDANGNSRLALVEAKLKGPKTSIYHTLSVTKVVYIDDLLSKNIPEADETTTGTVRLSGAKAALVDSSGLNPVLYLGIFRDRLYNSGDICAYLDKGHLKQLLPAWTTDDFTLSLASTSAFNPANKAISGTVHRVLGDSLLRVTFSESSIRAMFEAFDIMPTQNEPFWYTIESTKSNLESYITTSPETFENLKTFSQGIILDLSGEHGEVTRILLYPYTLNSQNTDYSNISSLEFVSYEIVHNSDAISQAIITTWIMNNHGELHKKSTRVIDYSNSGSSTNGTNKVLTQAEYDALETKDANTIYFIKE